MCVSPSGRPDCPVSAPHGERCVPAIIGRASLSGLIGSSQERGKWCAKLNAIRGFFGQRGPLPAFTLGGRGLHRQRQYCSRPCASRRPRPRRNHVSITAAVSGDSLQMRTNEKIKMTSFDFWATAPGAPAN